MEVGHQESCSASLALASNCSMGKLELAVEHYFVVGHYFVAEDNFVVEGNFVVESHYAFENCFAVPVRAMFWKRPTYPSLMEVWA